MGLVGVILSDKMIKYLVPDYKMTPAKNIMDSNLPMYCMYNKVMGKTCFLVTCPQIGSTLVRPGIGLEGKFWTRYIYLAGAKYLSNS